MPAKKKQPETTTIQISTEHQKELNKMRRGYESYDDILSRLMDNQFDVFIEFLLIDNELPALHTAAFQLGTDTDSVFYFDGKDQPRSSSLEEINKFMKQSKPNFTLTVKEAELAEEALRAKCHESGNQPFTEFMERLKNFVENQPE